MVTAPVTAGYRCHRCTAGEQDIYKIIKVLIGWNTSTKSASDEFGCTKKLKIPTKLSVLNKERSQSGNITQLQPWRFQVPNRKNLFSSSNILYIQLFYTILFKSQIWTLIHQHLRVIVWLIAFKGIRGIYAKITGKLAGQLDFATKFRL
jgi:hypothetical protein